MISMTDFYPRALLCICGVCLFMTLEEQDEKNNSNLDYDLLHHHATFDAFTMLCCTPNSWYVAGTELDFNRLIG